MNKEHVNYTYTHTLQKVVATNDSPPTPKKLAYAWNFYEICTAKLTHIC